ncbi:MAG TPA: hypothetical protein VH643_34270 [Gemmataceae bacterium]|jgi:hypothetical protein
MAWKPSGNSRLFLCFAFLALAGCQEQEQIRSYSVSKENLVVGGKAEKLRLLAVMVPHQKDVWFFKLIGPDEAVKEQVETFDRFVTSVHFFGEGSAKYARPEGWQKMPGKQLPGNGQVIEQLRREVDGASLDLTVTTLPAGEKTKDPRSNIDRWRGQLGLGPINDAELNKLVGNVKVDGEEGTRVDFTGRGKKQGQPPFARGRPFRFTKPEDWEERPPDAPKGIFRPAVFRVHDGEQAAEVSVVPLGGHGGGPLANVNRWRGQLKLDPIGEDELRKDLRELKVADGSAPYVDLVGKGLTGEPQRILGAWIVRGGRTWFITMKGSPELVGKQQAAFEAFVQSIRFADGGGAAQ